MVIGKSWAVYIEEAVSSLVDMEPPDDSRPTMFRVPTSIRRAKPHMFTAQVMPFGLYALQRLRPEKAFPMDGLKVRMASLVLKVMRSPYSECSRLYSSALGCMSLSSVTPNQLAPILTDLVSSLGRLPFVSRETEGKLEMMRGRIAGLRAMCHAPNYELREREVRLLAADVESCFQAFSGFLGRNSGATYQREGWKWLCQKVVGNAAVTDLYEDVAEVQEEAAVALLTLDAIFLVAFMLALHAGLGADSRIRIEELGWFHPVLELFKEKPIKCNIEAMAFDVWLMENQIPLEVIRNALECMLEVSSPAEGSAESARVLSVLVKHLVKRVLHLVPGDWSRHSTSLESVPVLECKHLLECLYRVVCPSGKIGPQRVRVRPSGAQTPAGGCGSFQFPAGLRCSKPHETSPSASFRAFDGGQSPLLVPHPSHLTYNQGQSSPPYPGSSSSASNSLRDWESLMGSQSNTTKPFDPSFSQPLPEPPSMGRSGGDPFSWSAVDRYRRSMGRLESGTVFPEGWNDNEVEVPFQFLTRSSSPPLPVSHSTSVHDDAEGPKSQGNMYTTVTIDLPQVNSFKLQSAGNSSSHGPYLEKLRTTSKQAFQSFRSAGSPSRLFRKIFGRVVYERRISFVGAREMVSASSKESNSPCPMPLCPVPSVAQLRKAGIRCRSGSQLGCKAMVGEGDGFAVFWPTLFLPKLLVDENTERLLQNLVAFELVNEPEHELMSFLHLMNDLVKTEEDVQILKQGKKAVLWLKSPIYDLEVITMFGSLLQGYHFNETRRSHELRKQLVGSYERPWSFGFHSMVRTMCTRSGILISLVAFVMMLVVLQTVYFLIDFYRRRD